MIDLNSLRLQLLAVSVELHINRCRAGGFIIFVSCPGLDTRYLYPLRLVGISRMEQLCIMLIDGVIGSISIYFIFDCSILFKADKMIPKTLVDKVSAAMAEGDVLKALKACESEPGPLANILSSAFSHVEEGFDVIQEAIQAAADIETERVMQRINWISVCGNIAPSLGLLGTVQGMIMAFEGLATGSPDVGALALAISQALWTTAGGLVVSIPSVTVFYAVRNSANRLILRMQALTFELVKDLRHVEVVE